MHWPRRLHVIVQNPDPRAEWPPASLWAPKVAAMSTPLLSLFQYPSVAVSHWLGVLHCCPYITVLRCCAALWLQRLQWMTVVIIIIRECRVIMHSVTAVVCVYNGLISESLDLKDIHVCFVCQVKFIHQGHWIKIKVIGAKTMSFFCLGSKFWMRWPRISRSNAYVKAKVKGEVTGAKSMSACILFAGGHPTINDSLCCVV